ncbi:hypothetical protein [Phaffia rhodozyma]|uniref:Methyltransferase domain-containing protein n=1 Tax=Phaffia rhodozyma TaxID=264483 RepID=A0A0F7SXR2_PHARH|nr:hypothetical protein [Phaffia rhodozyma]
MYNSKYGSTFSPGRPQHQHQYQHQHQPPLAKRPKSHIAYDTLLQIARTPNLKVFDVGCGPGGDLIELLTMGARPSDLIGIDLEPQFSKLACSLAEARSLPVPPFEFVQADVGGLLPYPALSGRTFTPGTMSGIICYRFFHLHPPETQEALLRWLLSLLSVPSSSSNLSGCPTPSILLGLQRSLPARAASGWIPISDSSPSSASSSSDKEIHWVYSSSDWHNLVESSVDEFSSQISLAWVDLDGLSSPILGLKSQTQPQLI